ncbi:MAG: hypothetical protein HRT89_01315 [Lentisphaeria bacterium]|nr:hypothetical protein [Lentisphaeria bacterium]
MKCFECHNDFSPDELIDIQGKAICGSCKVLVIQKFKEGLGFDYDLCRKNQVVIIKKGSKLPANCLRCGDETVFILKRKTKWIPPNAYLLLLLGILPYIIYSLFYSTKITLDIPMCKKHKMWHYSNKWAMLGCLLISVLCIIVGHIVISFFAILLMFVFMAQFITYGVSLSRVSDDHLYFVGLPKGFVKELPKQENPENI